MQNFSDLLWSDFKGNQSPDTGALAATQRLSSVSHVIIPIDINGRNLNIVAFHATPPVFDGPEDRNGKRNADEILLVQEMISVLQQEAFVIAGNANLDPEKGEGKRMAIQGLLKDPRLAKPDHLEGQDTANWG